MPWYPGAAIAGQPYAGSVGAAMSMADQWYTQYPQGSNQVILNGPGGYWYFWRTNWLNHNGDFAGYNYPITSAAYWPPASTGGGSGAGSYGAGGYPPSPPPISPPPPPAQQPAQPPIHQASPLQQPPYLSPGMVAPQPLSASGSSLSTAGARLATRQPLAGSFESALREHIGQGRHNSGATPVEPQEPPREVTPPMASNLTRANVDHGTHPTPPQAEDPPRGEIPPMATAPTPTSRPGHITLATDDPERYIGIAVSPETREPHAESRGPVYLSQVMPPGPAGVGGIPIGTMDAERKKWISWKEWLPYNAYVTRFEFEYFDLSSAELVAGSTKEYRSPANMCFRCTKFRKAARTKVRVDLLLTYWCEFKAFKPKGEGAVRSAILSALPSLRVLWAVKNLLFSGKDPTAVIESVWGIRDAIKDLLDPPPKQRPKYDFTFVRAQGKTKTSADWVLDYTNPKMPQSGTFLDCEQVFDVVNGAAIPKFCPDAPLLPEVWDPEPGSTSEYIHPYANEEAAHLPFLFDPQTGIDHTELVPDYFHLDRFKVIEKGLLPWKSSWRLRRLGFEARQGCENDCSGPPCFPFALGSMDWPLSNKTGFVYSEQTEQSGKWYPVSAYEQGIFGSTNDVEDVQPSAHPFEGTIPGESKGA